LFQKIHGIIEGFMKGKDVLVKYQGGESFGVHDAPREVLAAVKGSTPEVLRLQRWAAFRGTQVYVLG